MSEYFWEVLVNEDDKELTVTQGRGGLDSLEYQREMAERWLNQHYAERWRWRSVTHAVLNENGRILLKIVDLEITKTYPPSRGIRASNDELKARKTQKYPMWGVRVIGLSDEEFQDDDE